MDNNNGITFQEVKDKTEERFYSMIDFGSKCWEWRGTLFKSGYGLYYDLVTKKSLRAHRYMFSKIFGLIPAKTNILHRCDNPQCCNPNHLFAGTQKDNAQDMIAKGRFALGSKHGKSKLTENGVRQIRHLLRQNLSCAEIAKRFDVGKRTIENVRQGIVWSHVK